MNSGVEFECRRNLQITDEVWVWCISITLLVIIEFFSFTLFEWASLLKYNKSCESIGDYGMIPVFFIFQMVLNFGFLLFQHATRIMHNELSGLFFLFIDSLRSSCLLVIFHIHIFRFFIICTLFLVVFVSLGHFDVVTLLALFQSGLHFCCGGQDGSLNFFLFFGFHLLHHLWVFVSCGRCLHSQFKRLGHF